MKRILIFFAIIILKISLFANWVEIPENSHNKLFECFSSNLETTELEFSLNGYESETIIEKGQSYQKISYWNEGEFVEIGKPDLPRFSRLVAIPNEGDVSIDIVYIDDEILSDINVYPRQQLQLDNQSKSTRFIKDEAF
nr:hypothetical protein [Candidatus Cloacimonadota bacterium]